MYRINSVSKQIVRLNVIEAGRPQLVDLLPKNFVFSEAVTDQMKMLEKDGVIRVRDAKVVRSANVQEKPVSNTQPAMEGKLDFVAEPVEKVAKVQKKKK